MLDFLVFCACVLAYIVGGAFTFGLMCATSKDNGRSIGAYGTDYGWEPFVVVSAIWWPFVLPIIVISPYPRRLGEWAGNRAIIAAEKRLEAKKLQLAARVRVDEELKKIEEQLDDELVENKTRRVG